MMNHPHPDSTSAPLSAPERRAHRNQHVAAAQDAP